MTVQYVAVCSPATCALWESGAAIPLFAALAVGFFVFLGLMKLAEMVTNRHNKWYHPSSKVSDLAMGGAGVVALICAGLTFKYLFI